MKGLSKEHNTRLPDTRTTGLVFATVDYFFINSTKESFSNKNRAKLKDGEIDVGCVVQISISNYDKTKLDTRNLTCVSVEVTKSGMLFRCKNPKQIFINTADIIAIHTCDNNISISATFRNR